MIDDWRRVQAAQCYGLPSSSTAASAAIQDASTQSLAQDHVKPQEVPSDNIPETKMEP